jgi:hypothetical protein
MPRIPTFKTSVIVALLALFGCLPASAATTMAWWRFEAGPADALVPHAAAAGVYAHDVIDSSGNGFDLSVWHTNDTGFRFRTNCALAVIPTTGQTNQFSVQNNGAYPCMFTQTGTEMQTTVLPAFTIEASYMPLATNTWRTIVGRDSYGCHSADVNLSALYLQITSNNAVAIKFCDVSGKFHEAISTNGIVAGFPANNPAAGQWYHIAAVSDGTNLSLYLNSGRGFRLVASTNMIASGSANRALTRGAGGGADWTNGVWTVGRGLYAGVHDNRAYGFIDEVRISFGAVSTNKFLFAYLPPEVVEDTTLSTQPGRWSPASFHASFKGGFTISYQWEISRDGGWTYTDVPGATSTNFTLSCLQATDFGWYRLRAMNSFGLGYSTPVAYQEPVTVAWWRFEEGPTNNAPVSHGGLAAGAFFPGVADSCGENDLSVWAEGWAGYIYRTNVPSSAISQGGFDNHFSIQNSGDYPGLTTASNSFLQRWSPSAFTIEVSFLPQAGSGYRTLVGRDAHGTAEDVDPDLSALYLQITPDDAVAIKFCDVSGYWHEAISPNGLITGYTGTNWDAGQWYHLAAVSDGTNLSLYLQTNNGHALVAQTDLRLSGSPNRTLTAGWGWGNDWTAGNWTIGRGLYGGIHTDRAYGFIDEVRISAAALGTEQLLFWRRTILVTTIADSGPNSLRGALARSLDGDTIDVTGVSGTITLTNGELVVSKGVTILGPGANALAVSGNHASRVFNVSGSNVVLRGLTVANGNNASGAGIYNSGTLMLADCTVSDNVGQVGGGIENGNILTLSNCTLSGNWAGVGGGIYNNGMNLTLTGCTLSGNSAIEGGGIKSFRMFTMKSCTLNWNLANTGGGIYCELETLWIGNTILNDYIYYGLPPISLGYNLSCSDNGYYSTNATDRVATNLMLGPLQDNGGSTWTYALLPGSPAIDAGDDSLLSIMSTDQRGLPRLSGAHVDIGAYEVQHPSGTPSLGGLSRSVDEAMQFNFTNAPGVQFAVQTTTNIVLPMTNWLVLPNLIIESPPGFYQFTAPSATNDAQRFYRARWEH